MTAKKGSMLLLKVSNGSIPESFDTVGGLQALHIKMNSQQLDATNCDSGQWRQLLEQASIQAISIDGHGIFIDSAAEETIRSAAFSGSIRNYRIYFGSGDYMEGPFYIHAYERSAQYDQVETYVLSLSSAGAIEYVGS